MESLRTHLTAEGRSFLCECPLWPSQVHHGYKCKRRWKTGVRKKWKKKKDWKWEIKHSRKRSVENSCSASSSLFSYTLIYFFIPYTHTHTQPPQPLSLSFLFLLLIFPAAETQNLHNPLDPNSIWEDKWRRGPVKEPGKEKKGEDEGKEIKGKKGEPTPTALQMSLNNNNHEQEAKVVAITYSSVVKALLIKINVCSILQSIFTVYLWFHLSVFCCLRWSVCETAMSGEFRQKVNSFDVHLVCRLYEASHHSQKVIYSVKSLLCVQVQDTLQIIMMNWV